MLTSDSKEIREYISKDLNYRINQVIEKRLQEWFDSNISQKVDEAIKKEFSKMMIVKFGE